MENFVIISDTHHHDWSSFSTIKNGVNSRLNIILEETIRAADSIEDEDQKLIIHAGDLFHVRGKISPSVLNPTLDTYKLLIDRGFQIYILSGNHDLETKHSSRISSAVTALEGVGVEVVSSPMSLRIGGKNMYMVPWIEDIQELKRELLDASQVISKDKYKKYDLIIHAPIDEVIEGIPYHGLTAKFLGDLAFHRVFAGHYHNHKDFGNGVYSIGALTHHTWSDVGSKAGFLTVGDKSVRWNASHAPHFIDLPDEFDHDEFELEVDQNYVRAKVHTDSKLLVDELRKWLEDCGALGTQINMIKPSSSRRAGKSIDMDSLNLDWKPMLEKYVDLHMKGLDDPAKVVSETFNWIEK